MNRFTRQIRLADVGEAGQAKLEAARVPLRTNGFARSVEEAYLRAAGAQVVDGERHFAKPDLGLRHDAARDVADGAYAALVAMREILGVTS